jgi:galactokinase
MTSAARERSHKVFASRIGDRALAREWWVPGRIEILGKHVDYVGGRSLLAGIDRGFHVLARPRNDNRIQIVDARSGQAWVGELSADSVPTPGRWTNYAVSVIRRIARDFPEASVGMDAVVSSSLPSAAGLSSSSALVISVFKPLATFNRLEQSNRWNGDDNGSSLAGYLGAVENGRAYGPFLADLGVGTHGGSQDHTAIIGCRSGVISQYRFLPVGLEREIEFPADWTFAIGSSGVSAAKTGDVRDRYNRLSQDASALLTAWNASRDKDASSLLDVLASSSDAEVRLAAILGPHPHGDALIARLRQFREECMEIVPAVGSAIASGDSGAIGALVDRSHRLADRVLMNQIPETNYLASEARRLGAHGASAFGAGFGGSVWALIPLQEADAWLSEWKSSYLARFPITAERADFFLSRPGPGAHEVLPGHS